MRLIIVITRKSILFLILQVSRETFHKIVLINSCKI